MPLRIAVQMDPLETINIGGDSTFAITLGALARGHRLWHYQAGDLCYRDGRVTAPARPITRLQRVAGDHFAVGDPVVLDLADDIDVVLMRQDPPFDTSGRKACTMHGSRQTWPNSSVSAARLASLRPT